MPPTSTAAAIQVRTFSVIGRRDGGFMVIS
jgi:hypothetical protein